MTKKQEQPKAYVPQEDDQGRLRTDRDFTPEEAAAVDRRNREARDKAHQRRFARRRSA